MRAALSGTPRKDGRWQITVTLTALDGTKVRKTLYAATQAEVQTSARALLNETGRTAEDPHTVAELIQQFKDEVWPHRKLGTLRQQGTAFKRIEAYFGGQDPRQLTKPMVATWVKLLAKEEGVGGRTVQAYRNCFSVLLKYAVEIGWAKENVATGVSLPAGVSAKPRVRPRLSPIDYRFILSKEDNQILKDYFETLGETGWRPSEALKLRTSDLFYSLDMWWLRGGMKTDAGENREIMLPDGLAHRLHEREGEWLFPSPSGKGPMLYNYAEIAWSELVDRAGVNPDTNMYQLRKLALSRWVHAGLPPDVIKALAGHTHISVVMDIYNRLGRDRLMMSLFTPESVTSMSNVFRAADGKDPI